MAPSLPSPAAPAVAAPSVIITPPPPGTARVVFAGDPPEGADTLGVDAPIALLAELVAHRGTAAPVCVGLLGGPGSGKSFALRRLVQRIRDLGAAAAASARGPFLSRIHVQMLDAAALEGDPALALAAEVYAGLRQPYPDLAREIAHAARDPHVVLREASEKLDEARRRLDAERRTLEESGSRLARLTETVLYEAAGSQVDAYARANRPRIESRLAAFGIVGDPIRDYKDLVHGVAASGGGLGLSLSALHAFKGQTRLIVLAVILALIGVGFGIALDTRDSWLAALHAGSQSLATVGAWLADHIDLLALARKAAFFLAVVAILANIARAIGFTRPILTGARLLRADVETRRRELGALYAHQTKRADALASDVERLSRVVNEAEARAGGQGAHAGLADAPPFETGARAQAHGVFAALGTLSREDAKRRDGSARAPRRIVLALDHLDAVAPERARLILDALHRIAASSGLVTVIAADPRRVGLGLADLERLIQVPLRLDAKPEARDYAAIVSDLLGRGPAPSPAAPINATRSALDEPASDREAALLATLAPLAGTSPRAIKRFVNLYRLVRLGGDGPKGALALMLALDQGGTAQERQAVEEAMRGGDLSAPLEPRDATPRLRGALDAVEALDGRLSKADVAAAAARATVFSVAAFV
jgi:hypothetical protein